MTELIRNFGALCSEVNFSPDCINLGQGHMNFKPPEWIIDAAKDALAGVETNQYAHPKGRIRLREAIKQFYGPHFGRELDIETEILVTSGATEGKLLSNAEK
jgi:kynurenine aminotransferase